MREKHAEKHTASTCPWENRVTCIKKCTVQDIFLFSLVCSRQIYRLISFSEYTLRCLKRWNNANSIYVYLLLNHTYINMITHRALQTCELWLLPASCFSLGEREKAVQQSLFPVYIKCSIFRRIWCQRQTLSSGWLCCSFSLFLLLVINLFARRKRATEEEKHELVLNPSELPLHDNMIFFFFFQIQVQL